LGHSSIKVFTKFFFNFPKTLLVTIYIIVGYFRNQKM
jgi:hypothetical protein